jgi:hypothetical protein
MTSALLIVVSLTGAGILGFLSAWFYQSEKIRKQYLSHLQDKREFEELRSGFDKLTHENEGLQLSIQNLQRLLESYENQANVLEKELLTTRRICEELYDAHKPHAKTPEVIKEIEVIREVPVLVFRENDSKPVTHDEKAAKLIRAFKKGIELETKRAG